MLPAEKSPASVFAVPEYGTATLADLAPSVLASLGVPGEPNPLGLEPSRRACVLLIDGMGWELLRAHRRYAPFLHSLLPAGTVLSAGFPTTTATSLTSYGTGTAPGHHGILGYKVAIPGRDRLINQLRWDNEVDPEVWQPCRTIYQRAEAAGVAASYVAAGAFEHGAFTRASARGSRYQPANALSELVVKAEAALHADERSYVFVYHSDLDTLGHMFGADSAYWRYQLGYIDRLAEQITGVLPPGTALYITADHGMVDISDRGRIDVQTDPELEAGVRLLGGEPRVRHVYTRPGAAADVLDTWRERLAGRAAVLSREEAVAEGWFGDAVAEEFLPRIGDILAVAYGDTALTAPATEEIESRLVGMHGSLTAAELRIPLLRTTSEAR